MAPKSIKCIMLALDLIKGAQFFSFKHINCIICLKLKQKTKTIHSIQPVICTAKIRDTLNKQSTDIECAIISLNNRIFPCIDLFLADSCT